MANINSGVKFWKPALMRGLRTAVVLAIPYVPTLITDHNYLLVASAAGFGALSSLIMSVIGGIPEATDTTVPWYFALIERVVKTSAQALIGAFGAVTLFQDVNWATVPSIVGTAAVGSLLLGVLGFLPEAGGKPVAGPVLVIPVPATSIDVPAVGVAVPVAPVEAPVVAPIVVSLVAPVVATAAPEAPQAPVTSTVIG